MQSIIRRLVLTVLVSGILATGVARAQVVIMDQIGPNISSFTGGLSASQQFEPDFSAFDIAAIDDFSATALTLQLVQVQALVGGFGGFVDFSGVTAYRVEIYSSHAAAQGNLVGDVASSTVSAGSATVDTGFTGSSTLALVTLPINILLPSSGVFYIAVIPVQDFDPNGQTGIGRTNYASANPGGANGFQTNPGGGFGFGAENPVNADLGYRIFAAVPEPSSFVLVGATLIAFGWRLRRGHRKA